ncbi:MAG TPA: amidohydrolase family protein [Terracidiphilus sp.]|nr:amidohydrolase family protein [Terracidiphilus sp.]
MVIPVATADRAVWLRVGILIDGSGASPLRCAHVVYSNKEILHAGEAQPPADLWKHGRATGEPDADLPEFTLLPGLTDAHTHIFLEGGELDSAKRTLWLKTPSDELFARARLRLEKILPFGVTSMRDCGDKHGVGLALSRLCSSSNRPLMPYIDSPGAAINHKGRYGGFMAEPLEDFASAADCVAARVKAGADRIKIIPTEIVSFKHGAVTEPPQMTTEEIGAIVRAAKAHNRQTMAHASGDEGIERAINARVDFVEKGGVDSIEHGFFMRDDQLAKLRDRNIAWVPTFVPIQKQVGHAERLGWDGEIVANLRRILDGHAESLVKAHAMGVQIIAGSDAGSPGVAHGRGLLEELVCMERAGLSSAAVIHAAAGAGAKRLAFKEKIGEIKVGSLSRFILTRHSPLETVANLQKEKIVIFDGEVIESGETPDVSGL